MSYEFHFNVVRDYWEFLIEGIWLTLGVTGGALASSMVLGLVLGVLRLADAPWLRYPAMAYIETFRNTPALVQLIWVYYCLPILTGLDLNAAVSCGVALAMYGAAYNAEIFRAGIQSIERGQIEAAHSIGLSAFHTFRHIVLPQAFRRMIPPLVNESITLLKFSSLVSVLGVADLTYQAQVLATTTFRPIEIFTFIAAIYFVLCGFLAVLARVVERRMSRAYA
ncbi:MAG: amino acid ABC transporter permease [Alphaproteobacteria bacterium]|nr:amino acid ABC transporter permease [Alphaproteobacteria bacterium]